MAKYYGVHRSEEYLAHYGVKGMRWGVQKAIETNNDKKLDRMYKKAQKKMQKLNLNADVGIQKEYAKRHARRAAIAAGIGLTGLTGHSIALHNARKALSENNSAKFRRREKIVVDSGKGVKKVGDGLSGTPGFVYPEGHWTDVNGVSHYGAPKPQPVGNTAIKVGQGNYVHPTSNVQAYNAQSAAEASSIANQFKGVKLARNLMIGAGAIGMGAAAYQAGKAITSKYRTTKKGHAKAVAKRDAFRKEMNAAFKGTRYDKNKRR